MKADRRGTALTLGVSCAFAVGAYWLYGTLAATAVVAAAAVVGLARALAGERRRAERLSESLRRETERAREVSDHAWQSALLAQIVDEVRFPCDERALLSTAASALGTTLKASRVVVYHREAQRGFRLLAQFTAEGAVALEPDATLPAILETDRELARRLLTSDPALDADPEVRALAERLQVHALMVLPVGGDYMLTVHECGDLKGWSRSSSEQRLVQRFADQLTTALTRVEAFRTVSDHVEIRSGMLRLAAALSGARETAVVAELVVTAAPALARCRAAAILIEDAAGELRVASQHGFEVALSTSTVQWLEVEVESARRSRAPVRLNRSATAFGSTEWTGLGPALIAPLLESRETIGILLLERSAIDEAWSDTDIETAVVLADLTASSMSGARRFESLQSVNATLRDLYEHAPVLYQTVDSRGRILDCNQTTCAALGYPKEELVGARFETLLAQSFLKTWRGLESELFAKGHVGDVELVLKSRDGRPIDVLVDGAVLPGADGERPSARVVLRDVSELRRLEHQVRQSQKLEVVGVLAGGIAHDFNNVLGGILGYASLLHAQLRDRPKAQRYVDTIERSAARGAELTGRLLAASRKAPARHEPVNLNQVVDETLELLAHTFNKNVRIVKRLDPRVRSVLADASQLQQVVLNLCVNARDAMPDGGSLRVETEVDERRKRLRLSVEDAGVGMESSTMQRLFEPFFSTKGERGTGLGLSVVYGIVKSMGGDVRVKSSPGEGARFDIFVPTRWVESSDRSVDLGEPARGGGELILLVDDERILRELGKEILEKQGYRVEAVASGEDALSFLRNTNEEVSLVILDLVMPGIDGGETLRRLRNVDDALPVLLSSGLTSEESVQKILAQGASGFIPKPYGIGELTHAVHAAIHRPQDPVVH